MPTPIYQEIEVSNGANELTWPTTVTELENEDISSDTISISLGTFDAAGTWQAPDAISRPTSSTAVVAMMVGTGTAPGLYTLRVKIGDGEEAIVRRGAQVRVS